MVLTAKEIHVAENKNQTPDKENNRAASNDSGKPADGGVGPVKSVILEVAAAFGKLWHAATDDGILKSVFRQGIDELGAALKAFPDAVQQDEVGTMWNPTQGEVASDRKHTRSRQPDVVQWMRGNPGRRSRRSESAPAGQG